MLVITFYVVVHVSNCLNAGYWQTYQPLNDGNVFPLFTLLEIMINPFKFYVIKSIIELRGQTVPSRLPRWCSVSLYWQFCSLGKNSFFITVPQSESPVKGTYMRRTLLWADIFLFPCRHFARNLIHKTTSFKKRFSHFEESYTSQWSDYSTDLIFHRVLQEWRAFFTSG